VSDGDIHTPTNAGPTGDGAAPGWAPPADPTPTIAPSAATTSHPAGTAAPDPPAFSSPDAAAGPPPEALVGAAFAGGLLSAFVLKRLGRH
jgi:hypothetical protein